MPGRTPQVCPVPQASRQSAHAALAGEAWQTVWPMKGPTDAKQAYRPGLHAHSPDWQISVAWQGPEQPQFFEFDRFCKGSHTLHVPKAQAMPGGQGPAQPQLAVSLRWASGTQHGAGRQAARSGALPGWLHHDKPTGHTQRPSLQIWPG